MKENGFVKLRIAGQNINFEEIAQMFLQKPSFIYRKGNCYTPKFGDKKPIIYEEDCCIYETQVKTNQTIDDAITSFISEFEKSKDYLKELSDKADITLWVSVYPEKEQSNIHLENKTLKLLADIGLVVDFDIMFLKEFYDETYRK